MGITVEIPGLHIGQFEVANHPARFRVLACGRRWGKTRLGTALCLSTAVAHGVAWWVAPSYPVATVGWRGMKLLARQIPGVEIKEGDRTITFPGNGWLQVRSADNPDSLRGEGLDFVVIDECAFVPEAAWSEALRPALADRQGRAMFISTPSGHNWFWQAFQWGQDPHMPEWASWQLPTATNPHIEPSEIEAARQLLPERVFAQEFLAEFMDDAGAVFRRIKEAATAEPQAERIPGHEYVMGVDWGKHNDFTVLTVMDMTAGAMAHLDRFNQIDYRIQLQRLQALYDRFRPGVILAERNSMGEPLVERLRDLSLPVRPFTTTNQTKAAIIDGLALAFERGTIKILPDPVLLNELLAFSAERLPSGLLRYGAPEGMHDDCVISLALAVEALATGAFRVVIV